MKEISLKMKEVSSKMKEMSSKMKEGNLKSWSSQFQEAMRGVSGADSRAQFIVVITTVLPDTTISWWYCPSMMKCTFQYVFKVFLKLIQNDYLASPTLRSILVVARASLFSSSASASTCQMWFQSCRSEKSTVILLIWARKTWNDEWRHLDGTATASPTCTSLQFQPEDNCLQASQLSRFHSRLRWAQTTSSSFFLYSPSVLNPLRQGSVF